MDDSNEPERTCDLLATEKCRSRMPASVTHVNTSLGTVAKLLTALAFMTRQGCHRASCLPYITTKLATALTTAASLYQNLQLTMPINPSILSSPVSSSRRRDSRMWHPSVRSHSVLYPQVSHVDMFNLANTFAVGQRG